MEKIAVLISLLMLTVPALGAPLSNQDRKDLELKTYTSCVKNQSKYAENASFSAKQISDFCDCVAETTSSRITSEDIESADNGDIRPFLKKSQAAYEYCAAAATQR